MRQKCRLFFAEVEFASFGHRHSCSRLSVFRSPDLPITRLSCGLLPIPAITRLIWRFSGFSCFHFPAPACPKFLLFNYTITNYPFFPIPLPPSPYFDPIRSKVTQGDPMLRTSAEGHNSKMQKAGLRRVPKVKLVGRRRPRLRFQFIVWHLNSCLYLLVWHNRPRLCG